MATREKADSKVGAKLATLRDGNSSGPDGQNRCDDTDNRRRGMDALLNCLKNLILPLLKGEDHICRCHCAREQAYHVVPYHEALEVYSPRHFMLPEDSMPVMVGLVVGVFIFWFLLWLVAILRSFKDDGSLSQTLRFNNTEDFLRPLHPPDTEDTTEADVPSDDLI